MLTGIIYTYAVVTVMILSAFIISIWQVFVHNKTTPSALRSLNPETLEKWKNSRKEVADKLKNLTFSQKVVSGIIIFISCLFSLTVFTFTWWLAPKTRLGMLKDVLTNNFVEIK